MVAAGHPVHIEREEDLWLGCLKGKGGKGGRRGVSSGARPEGQRARGERSARARPPRRGRPAAPDSPEDCLPRPRPHQAEKSQAAAVVAAWIRLSTLTCRLTRAVHSLLSASGNGRFAPPGVSLAARQRRARQTHAGPRPEAVRRTQQATAWPWEGPLQRSDPVAARGRPGQSSRPERRSMLLNHHRLEQQAPSSRR